ncbi:MAG TPA: DNA gyrase inhibitor YacG [Stellaceae bacterium]|jgi:hypothetical protein|nr:DNA gyrase inhibitor YacG [Stellaceae bacterium]
MANDLSIQPPRLAPCPICGKPAVRAQRPFCSPRCRNVDLGRWLHGVYRVETDESDVSEADDDA